MAPESSLIAREVELDRVETWLGFLAEGPGALLIWGDVGIGKTSLWTAALDRATARGIRVLQARAVEGELPLGFATLGDLLATEVEPVLGDLPEPLAQAMSAAVTLGGSTVSDDPLLVGRATLAAIRALARDAPLVIAVDDAPWVDAPTARALAFAARRLGGMRVGFALTLREGAIDPIGIGSAMVGRAVRIDLNGMSFGAIGHLVRTRVSTDLTRTALRRIYTQSAGNPLYALELARAPGPALPRSLDELARARLRLAPSGVTAAVRGPQPVDVFPDAAALDTAVAAGVLVERDGVIMFAHPILASAAHERLPPARRRRLHLEAAMSASTADERAHHLALATSRPDADVAQLLEEAAHAARERGAPETAADLAAHAIRLTPQTETAARDRRTMDRAEYLILVADPAAEALITGLIEGPTTGVTRARALVQRSLTETVPGEAVARLEEAVAIEHEDRRLAVRAMAQLAWQRGAWLGDLRRAIGESRTAVARAESLGDGATLAVALTTEAQLLSVAGRAEAAGVFRRAVEVRARTVPAPGGHVPGDHVPEIAFAHERWWRGAFDEAQRLLDNERDRADRYGDESMIMRLNAFEGELAVRRGRWDDAERRLTESLIEAHGFWRAQALAHRAILRGRRGDPRAADDVANLRALPVVAAEPVLAAVAAYAEGLLELARGDVASAAALLEMLPRASERSATRGPEFAPTVPETIAVILEAGMTAAAEGLIGGLARRRDQLGLWGAGATSLCRGLVAAEVDAPSAILELESARKSFVQIGAPWELGLTLLAHGRVLRRQGSRRDAAALLDLAIQTFDELGAAPMSQRASVELRRARPRPRHDGSLTEAERQVAGLVAAGQTNRQVAGQLFVTEATVEAHLTRIYAKLGVRSRTQLARGVSDGTVRLDEPMSPPSSR